MSSKRKNGEGAYDRVVKSGITYYRWRGTLGVDPVSGRPNRKTLYARSDRELRDKVKSALSAYELGAVNAPKKLTVAGWLDQWLSECCQDVKPLTLKTYRSRITTHIIPALGAVRLSDLTPGQVQAFVNSLGDLSPKTSKCVHGVLHRSLEKALQWGYIPRNPADGCSLPRMEKREVGFLAGDDLRRFIQAIRGDEYEAVFLVAIFTGMREGELLGQYRTGSGIGQACLWGMTQGGGVTLDATVVEGDDTTVAQRQLNLTLTLLTGNLTCHRAVDLVSEPVLTSHSLQLKHTVEVFVNLILTVGYVSIVTFYSIILHNSLR